MLYALKTLVFLSIVMFIELTYLIDSFCVCILRMINNKATNNYFVEQFLFCGYIHSHFVFKYYMLLYIIIQV